MQPILAAELVTQRINSSTKSALMKKSEKGTVNSQKKTKANTNRSGDKSYSPVDTKERAIEETHCRQLSDHAYHLSLGGQSFGHGHILCVLLTFLLKNKVPTVEKVANYFPFNCHIHFTFKTK